MRANIKMYPSNKFVNILNPDPDNIHIEDICHSLSLINRFNGHIARPYSVLAHSIMVCRVLMKAGADKKTCLTGLLHDASEYLCGDMTSPLKACIPKYRKIENRVQKIIAKKFDLHYPFPKVIHEVDAIQFYEELHYLKNDRIKSDGVAASSASVQDLDAIRQDFMKLFKELSNNEYF